GNGHSSQLRGHRLRRAGNPNLREEHRGLLRIRQESFPERVGERGVLALRLSVVEDGEQGPQDGGRDGRPHDELTERYEEEAQILRMAYHGVNAIRDEDRPSFE